MESVSFGGSDVVLETSAAFRRLRTGKLLVPLAALAVLAIGVERIVEADSQAGAWAGVAMAGVGAAASVFTFLSLRFGFVRTEPFVAGLAATWAALIVGAVGRRAGVDAQGEWYRLVWAPVTEEILKCLAIAWTVIRARPHRREGEMANDALGVAAGFAAYECVLALTPLTTATGVSASWVACRAVAPAFAHAAFALVVVATLTTGAAPATIRGMFRVSRLAAAVILAVFAHVAYNAVASLVVRADPSDRLQASWMWAIAAALLAIALREDIAASADARAQPHDGSRALGVLNEREETSTRSLLARALVGATALQPVLYIAGRLLANVPIARMWASWILQFIWLLGAGLVARASAPRSSASRSALHAACVAGWLAIEMIVASWIDHRTAAGHRLSALASIPHAAALAWLAMRLARGRVISLATVSSVLAAVSVGVAHVVGQGIAR